METCTHLLSRKKSLQMWYPVLIVKSASSLSYPFINGRWHTQQVFLKKKVVSGSVYFPCPIKTWRGTKTILDRNCLKPHPKQVPFFPGTYLWGWTRTWCFRNANRLELPEFCLLDLMIKNIAALATCVLNWSWWSRTFLLDICVPQVLQCSSGFII